MIPFIEVYAKNFNMMALSREEKDVIIQKYILFSPQFIRFYESEKIAENDKVEINFIIYAGNINSLKKLSKPDKYNEEEIKMIDNMEFYDNYVKEFEMFNSEKTEDDWSVPIESYETLYDLLKNKKLFYISIDNRFAGVFGIKRIHEKYFDGWLIVEEILYKDFRYKGYGKAVQRKVIDTIDSGDNEFFYGFIHPKNKASYKTAGKNGRFPVVYSYLLKI